MKTTRLLATLFVASLFFLTACATDTSDDEKTFIVGPELVECTGEGPQLSMQVKENPEDDWQLFYSQLEGFNYEEGYQYVLRVSEQPVENPPAGGSSIRW